MKIIKSFKDVVIEEYLKSIKRDELCVMYYGNFVYAPISKLRKGVRGKLNITNKEFDELFLSMKRETSKHLIHLTQPMLRGSGGIHINGRYYHFIGIFKK